MSIVTLRGQRNDFHAGENLYALLRDRAAPWLDRPAVVGSGGAEPLTYRAFFAQVERLARAFQADGVGVGAKVLVPYRPDPLCLAAELAVAACGGVFVPVDAAQPVAWIRHVATLAGVERVAVIEEADAGLAPGIQPLFIRRRLDETTPGDTPFTCSGGGGDPYCIFFTSGTTGANKGVVMPHDGILRLCLNNSFCLPGPGDVFLQLSSPAFDAFCLETWLPLANGAATVLLDRGALSSPDAFAETLTRNAVTHLWLTAGLFSFFAGEKPAMFRELKMLMAGGDVVNPAVAAAALAACPNLVFLNGYGPTENSTFTTTHRIAPGENPIRIGLPIANTDVHLVPVDGEAEASELWCSGPGLALGYLGADGKIADGEKFTVLSTESGPVRAYNTGDLARLDDAGRLLFLGRRDNQVKIRGYRIELAEVEEAIASYPGVVEAAVVAVTGAGGDKRLAAAVHFGAAPDLDGLRHFLAERLPDYLRPGLLQSVDRLPLNFSGKVDKTALESRFISGVQASVDSFAKTQDVAVAIAHLFAAELSLDEVVSPDDDFFRLGGHSIGAMRIIAKLESLYAKRLTMSVFFAAPTPVGLAAALDREPVLSRHDCQSSFDEVAEINSFQRSFFIQQKLHPDSPAYNVPLVLQFDSALDDEAFREALALLWRRHEILRACAGEDMTLRYPNDGWSIPEWEPVTESAIAARTKRSAMQPFGLQPGESLARAHLWRAGESRFLLLVIFHGLIDHWGCDILLRDLGALYNAITCGLPLPPPPPSYRSAVAAISLDQDAASWWSRALSAPASPATLLPDILESDNTDDDFTGDTITFSLVGDKLTALREFARDAGVPLFTVLTALWGVSLARRWGMEDEWRIRLGLPVSFRDSQESQQAAGLFLNTLPLAFAIRPEMNWRDVCRAVAQARADLMAHARIGPEKIVAQLRADGGSERSDLFHILIAHTPALDVRDGFTDVAASCRIHAPGSKFDVSLIFAEDSDRLDASIEFKTRRYTPDTIRALAQTFVLCADAAAAAPDAAIGSLDILTPADIAAIGPKKEYPLHRPLDEILSERATDFPDEIAIRDGEAEFTFAEFDDLVDVLARRMRDAAFIAGDFAGLFMTRSAANLVAARAALRLGGAFVPLDPNLPSARLRDMVADCGGALRLIITVAEFQPLAVQLAAETGAAVLAVHEIATAALLPLSPDHADPSENSAAYALFTSGTTGRPKGAVNANAGLVNRLFWMHDAFPLGPDDVILHKTPLSFDVSVWELFWFALAGCRVVVMPDGGEKDADALCRAIRNHAVTTLHFVPSMLREFLFWVDQTGRCDDLTSLRRIIVSGEALDRDLAATCLRQLPWVELHNLYGPAEAAIDVTWEPCRPETIAREKSGIPIGKPTANNSVLIMEHAAGALRQVPAGVPGEIVLAGVQVGLGYLNRPELTDSVFVHDEKLGRLYRTGDRGRFLPDGRIEFMGRIAGDTQLKVRGQRIETGEIETVLGAFPGVRRAVVQPIKQGDSVVELHAWIQTDDVLYREDIAAFAATRLSDAMLPTRYFRLNAIPLNPSGKLDRAALAASSDVPELPTRDTVRTAVADPAIRAAAYDAVESDVADLWEKTLGHRPASHDQGFFDAGGNSLLLIRLHAFLEQYAPGRFKQPDLFRFATVRSQAARIREQSERAIPAKSNERKTRLGAVAIVGAALRLADYNDWARFEQDILAGACRIGPPPGVRGSESDALLRALGGEFPGTHRQLAYLDDATTFAPGRFHLSRLDATLMDPGQRQFLETAVRCLEAAGKTRENLLGMRMGLFVTGSPDPIYRQALTRAFPEHEAAIFTHGVPSAAATRLSHLFDWRGPASVVDTACSSGLAALHLACLSLAAGDCDEALIGGGRVALDLTPRHLPILSPRHRPLSYDREADGTGEGEGAFAFLLKPLEKAIADGDSILAVVSATAMNQDGASASATAPNPEAQAALIREAIAAAGLTAEAIGYIEGHGTGTKLGDPIELSGLRLALGERADAAPRIGLGSGKGNFGHLDHAAGFLGLARAMVALKHRIVPPQPGFVAMADAVEPECHPCFVTAAGSPWRQQKGIAVGVSAFGISGTNAHAVLTLPPPGAPTRRSTVDASLSPEAPRRKCYLPEHVSTSCLRGSPVPLNDGAVLSIPLHDPAFWPMAEHRVAGKQTLVGMALPELFGSFHARPLRLSQMYWLRPAILDAIAPGSAQVRQRDNRLTLEGKSPAGEWTVFARADLSSPDEEPLSEKATDIRRQWFAEGMRRDSGTLTHIPDGNAGLVAVGEQWRTVAAWWREDGPGGRQFALLKRPDGDDGSWSCHPGLLDAASSLGLNLARDAGGVAMTPFSCAAIDIIKPVPTTCLAVFTPLSAESGQLSGTLWLGDSEGETVAVMRELVFRPAGAPPAAVTWQRQEWVDAPLPVSPAIPLDELVFVRANGSTDIFSDVVNNGQTNIFTGPLVDTTVRAVSDSSFRGAILSVASGDPTIAELAALLKATATERLVSSSRPLFFLIVCDGSVEGRLTRAALSGLAAVAQLEMPHLACRCVETASSLPLDKLLAECADLAAIAKNGDASGTPLARASAKWDKADGVLRRFAPALTNAQSSLGERKLVRAGEHYVVTGGLGGMGLVFAKEILDQGGFATLLYRTPPSSTNSEGKERLSLLEKIQSRPEARERLRLFVADVADKDSLTDALSRARADFGPIHGVFHAAGIGSGGLLWTMTGRSLDTILAPKIAGTRNLHELTAADPVRLFILFSSRDVIYPEPGQAGYAAANAWQNEFALIRRQCGLPATAILLPTVAGLGMARRHGVDDNADFTIDDVVPLIRSGLTFDDCVVGPVRESASTAVVPSVPPAGGVREASLTGRRDGDYSAMEKTVAASWARHLGEDQIDVNATFASLGGDSLAAIEILADLDPDGETDLNLISILGNATIADIARILAPGARSVPATHNPHGKTLFGDDGALPPPDADGFISVPMTPSQADIWQSDLEFRADTAYNLPLFLELSPDVDLDRLQTALTRLMARHQSLRMEVVPASGEESNTMRLHPATDENCRYPLEIIRVDEPVSGDGWPAILERAVKPIDLRRYPLCCGVAALARDMDGGRRVFAYFDVHHIIADGISLEVFKRDLAALYDDRPLPEANEGFANFAMWEHRHQASRNNVRKVAELLRADPQYDPTSPLPPLRLPEQRDRPPLFSFNGSVHAFRVESGLLSAVRNKARELGVTTASFMLGIWGLALGRYVQGERFAVSIGDSGRFMGGMDGIFGQFSASVPIILDLTNADFADYMRSVHARRIGVASFLPASVAYLAEELDLANDSSHATVVQAIFSYMNYAHYRVDGEAGLFRRELPITPKLSSKGDVVIFSQENADDMEVFLEYYSDAFDASLFKSLARTYVRILEEAAQCDAGAMPLSRLDGLDPLERENVLAWGRGPGLDSAAVLAASRLVLPDFLKKTVLEIPDAIALSDNSEQFTYAELWENATRLAACLMKRQVVRRNGMPVAILMNRSAREKIAQLAVLLAGGVVVPLNPRHPDLEIRQNIALAATLVVDGGALFVLTDDAPHFLDWPAESNPLHLNDCFPEKHSVPETWPIANAKGDDDAFILFTSGTTGKPKAIRIPHRSIVHMIMEHSDRCPRRGEKTLQTAASSFDAAILDVWDSWRVGAWLVVPDDEELLDTARLAAKIRDDGIGHFFMTPSLLKRLAVQEPSSLRSVRAISCGGEAVGVDLVQRIREAAPDTLFYCVYGPAETGVLATTIVATPELCSGRKILPLGYPAHGTRVEVTDAHGRICPPYVWGEIVIGGWCVSNGYLGNAVLKDEKFSHPDPGREKVDAAGNPLWYRTGDIGRWHPADDPAQPWLLEFGGREDDQVKIRGWRVEPSAIEERLRRNPFVREAAVLVEETPSGEGVMEKSLVACIAARPGFSLDDLRRQLRAELPQPQIPSRFVALDGEDAAFPVTMNGKLDRKALALMLPNLRELSAESSYEPPRTSTEQAVAEAYSSVLRVSGVGRKDNFFDLGGHSLLAVRIRNQLANALAVDLAINSIFHNPEVDSLAAHIDVLLTSKSGSSAATVQLDRIPAAPPAPDYPATYAQSRLYIETLLDQSGRAYLINTPMQLHPSLDADALSRTLAAVMARHEALRTSFVVRDGEVRQVIHDGLNVPFADEGVFASDEEALARLRDLIAMPIPLDQPPLWGVHLLRTGDAAILLIRLHHILTDGWGMHELFRDMNACYAALRQGGDLPALSSSPALKDIALWQTSQADSYQDNCAWWKDRLQGAPGHIDLPEDFRRPRERGSRGDLVRMTLPAPLPDIYNAAARRRGVSLSAWLLAHFVKMLSRLSGQDDLVVGVGIAARDRLEFEEVVGFFMNVLPMRFLLDDDEAIDDCAKRVYAEMLAAFERHTFAFDQLVRAAAGDREPGYPPLFNVNFEYQNFPAPEKESFLGGPPERGIDDALLAQAVDPGTAKGDLGLYCLDSAGGLTLLLEYNSEVIALETAQAWLDYYRASLDEENETEGTVPQ